MELKEASLRGQEAIEDFRLLNDLGWGDGTGDPVELTMPAEGLASVLVRYRETATRQLTSEQREEAEAREDAQEAREVAQTAIEVCSRVLGELDVQGKDT